MAVNDFSAPRGDSAHDRLLWRFLEGLPEQEIESIMVRAEAKAEIIAHGRLLAGRPLGQDVRNRLIQTAILREINFRAG